MDELLYDVRNSKRNEYYNMDQVEVEGVALSDREEVIEASAEVQDIRSKAKHAEKLDEEAKVENEMVVKTMQEMGDLIR